MATNHSTTQHPRFIHGESVSRDNTPEYQAYNSAKGRCNNPKDKSHHRYGGRGIEFRFNSYFEFLTEVGRRPSPEHSIHRIDNDGHYEKGNLMWATKKIQNRHTSHNRYIEAFGKTLCLNEWAEITGISREAIRNRIDRHGWCVECALTLLPRMERCPHRPGYESYSEDYGKRRQSLGGPVRRMRKLKKLQQSS